MAEGQGQDNGLGPLGYRSRQDESNPHVERLKSIAKMAVGFVLGVIGIVVSGFFSAGLAQTQREFQFRSVPLGVTYFLLALGGVWTCVWGLWRPPRRWFLGGLLLGAALASLMEGACFLSG